MATCRFLVLAGLSGVAACIPEPEPTTATATASATATCGYGCGDNGGLIDGVPFWGLYLNHDENEQQVKYLRFARTEALMDSKHYSPLDVDGSRLRVWFDGSWHDSPTALTDGILRISVRGAEYNVKIAAVHSGTVGGTVQGEEFWTRTNTDKAVTYQFQWTSMREPPDASGARHYHEVCAYTMLDDDEWQNQIDAVVFEGDKYNLDTKDITTNDVSWFNIACEGSLPAKMFLTRRTTASSDGALYVSSVDTDRQAMVRAYAAEYCGNGISFTQTGHKLRIMDHMPFTDDQGWLPRYWPIGFPAWELKSPSPGFAVEAVWNKDQAVCLETPRLAVPDPNIAIEPGIEDRIAKDCEGYGGRPPPCSQQSWFPGSWTDHGDLITATIQGKWP